MGKTYCSLLNCVYTTCSRHQHNAPPGSRISIANLNDGYCYMPNDINYDGEDKYARLLLAICRGTQKTGYQCDTTCKALCGNDGGCNYCAFIADAIVEEFRK